MHERPSAAIFFCEYESDLRSNEHYLGSSENKAWKIFRPVRNVMTWAQLVEHCKGIAEVMGSNPVRAWIFFKPYFHQCLSSVHHCEDRFDIHLLHRSSYI